MKAVGYKKSLPVEDADSLIDFEAAKPEPRGRDLRVAVKAVSANPVDYKVRKRAGPPEGETKILGYDAAGIVDAVGPDVTLFKPGDEVFYAGSIQRQGTNSEFHLVDERIVGRKPKTLSCTQAAALPLTSITAWELGLWPVMRSSTRPQAQVTVVRASRSSSPHLDHGVGVAVRSARRGAGQK